MKIAVYTITKNEEQFVERWAESCKEADIRLIVDTGSTDRTLQLAEQHGCSTASIKITPWRFDDARNAALALIPEDIDICIALDADEVLTFGWRQHLEQIDPSVTRPRYKYVWSWNPDGSEGLVYYGDKIHARNGYRWVHPVHEVLTSTGTEVQGNVGLEIHHYPDHTKSRSQYLPLLELAVRERPDDDRNQFYLGREYMYNGLNAQAEQHLLKHLELSTWPAERATAMRYLSRVTDRTEHWLLRACAEAPDRREPWVELATFYHNQKLWPQSFAAATRALVIGTKPLEYLCEADAWGSLPYDLAGVAAWNLGMSNKAIQCMEAALERNMRDQRLRNNLIICHRLSNPTDVTAVIPTKSNTAGLFNIVEMLHNAPRIARIVVIADGQNAYDRIAEHLEMYPTVVLRQVDEGVGIHAMWNIGLAESTTTHCLFLNDDVAITPADIEVMSSVLDKDSNIGLICPNYDDRVFHAVHEIATTTCRGRYDGTGGLAGFCMMLTKDLVSSWKFDERMKWWYGDDDVLMWVTRTQKRKAIITSLAACSTNQSWTITNDPPAGFDAIVDRDRTLFALKWGG